MKNRKNVLLWTLAIAIYIAQLLAAVYIALVIIVFAVYGNETEYENVKADDAISRSFEKYTGENVYYLGKEKNAYNAMNYEILLRHEEDAICDIIEAVNGTLENEGITDKVSIMFYKTVPGGLINTLKISNYSDYNLEKADFESLQWLLLRGDKIGGSEFYNNPATYRNIPDIRYLQLTYNMRVMAAQNKVDWYEYWPELEKIEELDY